MRTSATRIAPSGCTSRRGVVAALRAARRIPCGIAPIRVDMWEAFGWRDMTMMTMMGLTRSMALGLAVVHWGAGIDGMGTTDFFLFFSFSAFEYRRPYQQLHPQRYPSSGCAADTHDDRSGAGMYILDFRRGPHHRLLSARRPEQARPRVLG